jgi:hypothetical protein
MRVVTIHWHAHEPVIRRDRYDYRCWLEGQGARVSAWMLSWQVKW